MQKKGDLKKIMYIIDPMVHELKDSHWRVIYVYLGNAANNKQS